MQDPSQLVELVPMMPGTATPVLVHALDGFVDAGGGVRLVREHLLATYESTLVATFDVDQLLDYRSRRPIMTFDRDHWESYALPALQIRALRDAGGQTFLLLTGPEPDVQWERFTGAVDFVARRMGVRLTIGLDSIPMAVPHTRPSSVTAHGSRPELVVDYTPWLQRAQVPASVGHLLEFRLATPERDTMGFAAHVPHYLANTEFPEAAALLLDCLAQASGLALPSASLHEAATVVRSQVDAEVAGSDDAMAMVSNLEQQYDAYVRERDDLLSDEAALPSADELGAELERFLADQARRSDGRGDTSEG